LAYPENRCDRVVVRFYQQERDALTELGPLGWVVQPDDRAIYAVSTYGHIGFCPHGPGPCPVYADHINSLYDATTGDGLGGGTAGQPPE
jgi:hypothetical protein